jgi:hypothetical protein
LTSIFSANEIKKNLLLNNLHLLCYLFNPFSTFQTRMPMEMQECALK